MLVLVSIIRLSSMTKNLKQKCEATNRYNYTDLVHTISGTIYGKMLIAIVPLLFKFALYLVYTVKNKINISPNFLF